MLICTVTGVVAVEPHHKGSKESQGNGKDADHEQPTNWEVFVKGYKHTIEFEVTRHDHISDVATNGQLTRTVMFKDPKKGMRKTAWHILMKVVALYSTDIVYTPIFAMHSIDVVYLAVSLRLRSDIE